MNTETLEALKESIAHWERLASGTEKEETPYSEDCPLCKMFAHDKDCAGCPVAERTGQPACDGSPWDECHYNWDGNDRANPKFIAAAKLELAFLKSLLPKEVPHGNV